MLGDMRLGEARRGFALGRDLRRFAQLPDRLRPSANEWRWLRLTLDPLYETYVEEVSDRIWAASLEVSALVWHLCRVTQPAAVLELGSGFTSYVLRRYADEAESSVEVVSVDHDQRWLARTQAFVAASGVGDEGFAEFGDLAELGQFGLVFNDLFGQLRDRGTRSAIAHLRPNGLFLIDDANRAGHRRALIRAGHGFRFYDVRPWTFDPMGRWSLLAARPG
jgi:SAM-dependent methyltransferase